MIGWAAMYLCTPPKPDPAADAALLVYLTYYVDCERHDRRVCTGPRDHRGDILPATLYEREVITVYARRRREWVEHELAASGASPDTCAAMLTMVRRMHFEGAVQELARLQAQFGGAT